MAITILNICVNFKQSVTTIVLKDIFFIDEFYHGWIVSIPPFFQIIGAFSVGMFIEKAPKRIYILAAFMILTVGDFLMGPSKIFNLPSLTALFFIGYSLSGLATGMISTPILPEIIDSVY